jgi:putative spermidine/putrescine transport system permease protein
MKSLRQNVSGIVLVIALFLFIIGPMLSVFLWAFAEQWRYPSLLPTQWGFKFWGQTFQRADIAEALPLSLVLSLVVTLLSALICLPAAYAFARLEFPGSQFFLLSFLATNAFPRFGLFITIAVIFLQLNLVSTVVGVILIQLVNTLLLMIWIPTAAFKGVDKSLEEAALDVGASPFRVFWQITLPQVIPAIGAALLLTFVSTFYETQGAILIGLPDIKTMPVLMINLINNQLIVQFGAILSVVLWLPSFILLLFARRILSSKTLAAGFGV